MIIKSYPYLDFLFSHEIIHLLVALLLSLLIYQWYKSFRLILLLLAVTIFIDADHLFDCIAALGLNFGTKDIYQGNYWMMTDRLFVPLHSWELLGLLWIICWWKKRVDIGLTITLGFVGHLLVDQCTYAMHPLAYSFIYRMAHGFRSVYFTTSKFFS